MTGRGIHSFAIGCAKSIILVAHLGMVFFVVVELVYCLAHYRTGGILAVYGWLQHVTPTRGDWTEGPKLEEIVRFQFGVVTVSAILFWLNRRLNGGVFEFFRQ